MAQSLFVVIALSLAGLLTVRQAANERHNQQRVIYEEMQLIASGAALKVIEYAAARSFDERTSPSVVQDQGLPTGANQFSMAESFGQAMDDVPQDDQRGNEGNGSGGDGNGGDDDGGDDNGGDDDGWITRTICFEGVTMTKSDIELAIYLLRGASIGACADSDDDDNPPPPPPPPPPPTVSNPCTLNAPTFTDGFCDDLDDLALEPDEWAPITSTLANGDVIGLEVNTQVEYVRRFNGNNTLSANQRSEQKRITVRVRVPQLGSDHDVLLVEMSRVLSYREERARRMAGV